MADIEDKKMPQEMGIQKTVSHAASVSSPDEDELKIALEQYVSGTEEETRLVRKIDLYMLPMLWWMCVLTYVDRNNIANAVAAGMDVDLSLSDSDYSLVISIFFVGYLIWEIPSNLILARTRPSYYIPGIMLIWGTLVASMSQLQSYQSLLVYRVFLGLTEAGFLPGVLYIMGCWYKKNEIGKRFSLVFTSLCFAGAVAGLISGAVVSGLDGARGMAGWRWLFLIEGVLTVVTAIAAKFVLLEYPMNTSRFSLRERQLSAVRILHDKHTSVQQAQRRLNFWQGIKSALCDLRTYGFVILYFLDNGASSISYFIPTVLSDMGYSGATKQWMTVPIWVVGGLFLLVVPQVADRVGDRRWSVAGAFAMAFISAVISATVKVDAVRYTFMCFYISGVYTSLPLILTWASDTIGLPGEKRAVAVALTSAVGNVAVIVGSHLWPSTDAPDYVKGFTVVSAFSGTGAFLAAVLPIIWKYLPTFVAAECDVLYAEAPVQRGSGEGESV